MTKTLKVALWTCVWTVVLLLTCFAVAQDAVLHIKIVAGDGGNHAPGSHAGKPLTVEVTDATGKPVAGAKVSFQVPEEGPSGLFTNGLRTDLATTDANGRATVHGLQLNRVAGSFNVRFTAAKEQARAGTIARLSIGGEQLESADRKAEAPAAAKTEPAPAPKPAAAPKQSAVVPTTVIMPGTTSKAPTVVTAQPQPVASDIKASAPLPGTVPTIIVTQKSSNSATEIGGGGKSHKKWIWIGLAVAGGAGRGIRSLEPGRARGAGSFEHCVGSGSGVVIGCHHRLTHYHDRKALMNRAILIVLLCGAAAFAQPKFSAPLIGVARDTKQNLRLVDGVTGSFVLRDAIGSGANNWAFAASGGLVQTGGELMVLSARGAVTRTGAAPEGGVVLGTANAFFPASCELWGIGAQSNHQIPIDAAALAGSVIALGPGSTHASELALCREKQLWLVSVDETSGAITQQAPVGGTIGEQACLSAGVGALVVLSDRLLLATSQEVLVQTVAGVERRIPISASHDTAPQLHQVGEQWVEVESAGATALMLRAGVDGETLYQLPAAKEGK